MANYIGKIAAVGTINMAQFSRGLDNSAKDVERFAKRISSTLSSANSAAARSFDQIFTPIQRLERAIQARSRDRLNIDTGGAEARIRALVGAAEDIARPLGSSAKAFSGLSATIQNEFVGSLVRAQNAATTAQNNITRGAIKNAQDYERYKRVVDETVISIRRLSEAGASVSGLASGQELRFQQAGLQSELQRAAAIQGQAGSLPASARNSRGNEIARIVALQQREAEEAARLLAILENIRNTRSEDYAAIARAQGALDGQVQRLGEVNSQLERQTRLVAELQALTSAGPRGNELIFTNPGVARELRSSAALRQAASEAADPSRFSGLLAQLNQAEDLVAQYQLEVQQRPRLGVDADDAVRRLEQARETARRVREEIEAGIDSQNREREIAANIGASTPLRSDRDPTGRTIQQRIRDIAAEREQRAAAEEALADRRRRVEAASTFLPPVITPPDPTAERTAQLQGISDRLGPDIASSAAEFARLEAATVQVKNQIDQLPAGVRTRFIPAIRDAEDELLRLAATDASPEELEQATQRVVQLRQEVGRTERAFNAFGGSFRDLADAGDFRRAEARLTALRQELLRGTGDTAQAEAAADRYAATLQRAASIPGGFRQLAAEINQVEQEAIQAAAAVSGISARRLNENLNRSGDVARGAFGNAGLAIQQAAFAVDDFFSVTGDLDQRIRAVGNNISQFGFVIGGTYGLIAGISASVGAQAISFLVKWANAGRTAEIQTKALNDALARQKSLVEELSQAFASLGDSIARSVFSRPGGEVRAFRRELEEIAKKQRELRNQRAFSLDEGVLRARADVRVAENALGAATTRDAAVAAQRQLAAARARLAAEEERVRRRRPISPQQVRNDVASEFEAATRRAVDAAVRAAAFAGGDEVAARREATIRGQQLEAAVAARLQGVNDPAEQTRILRDEQQAAQRRGDDRLVAELEAIIDRIEGPVRVAADRFVVTFLEAANKAASGISIAQDRVAQAIADGIPSAIALQQVLDSLGDQINTAQQEIADAQRDFAESAQTPEDLARRDARVRAAQASVDAGNANRELANNLALELDRRRIVDPQSLFSSRLERARQNLAVARLPEGQIARELRELDARRSQVLREIDSASGDDARKAAANELEAINQQIAAVEGVTSALRSFSDALNQAEDGVNSRLQQAQQQLDNAIERDVAFSTPLSRRDVRRAEEDLERQRRSAQTAQDALQNQRARVEEALALALPRELVERQTITEELASGSLTADQQAQRRARLAEIDREIAAIAADVERQAREAVRQDILERQRPLLEAAGQQFLQSPGQRAAEQLARDFEGIRLAAARTAEETTGLIDQAAVGEARQRAFRQSAEQVAPLLVGFSDEVANALLQGPSRAALQASDASTLQGQQELNRLLRGEDPARDVNLLELQKQTRELQRLVELAEEGPQVAQ